VTPSFEYNRFRWVWTVFDGLLLFVLEDETNDFKFASRKFHARNDPQPLALAEERLQTSALEAGGDHGGRFRGTKVQHWFGD
jgi:hypothetical protein